MDAAPSSENQSISLPVVSMSRWERKGSILKEKIYLIIVSSILLGLSSLRVSLFIVQTLVTTPSYDHVESTINVTSLKY